MNLAIAISDIEAFMGGQPVKVQLPTESIAIGALGHITITGEVTVQKVA